LTKDFFIVGKKSLLNMKEIVFLPWKPKMTDFERGRFTVIKIRSKSPDKEIRKTSYTFMILRSHIKRIIHLN